MRNKAEQGMQLAPTVPQVCNQACVLSLCCLQLMLDLMTGSTSLSYLLLQLPQLSLCLLLLLA